MKRNAEVLWEGIREGWGGMGVVGGCIIPVTTVGGCWHLSQALGDSRQVLRQWRLAHYPTAYCILTVMHGDFCLSTHHLLALSHSRSSRFLPFDTLSSLFITDKAACTMSLYGLDKDNRGERLRRKPWSSYYTKGTAMKTILPLLIPWPQSYSTRTSTCYAFKNQCTSWKG